MRNGVVHVEKIESDAFRHFGHFGGERQGVGRMVEEGIGGHLDFMEVDVVARVVQANRHGVADEMDFMAARGQLDAEGEPG